MADHQAGEVLGVRPQDVPIVQVDTDLPELSPECMGEYFLRERFQNPPAQWHRETMAGARFGPDKVLRQAAVLLPIIPTLWGAQAVKDRGDFSVLLTKRSAQLRHHAGQISFPGGKIEADDGSAAIAALRETHEEIGIAPLDVDVLGELSRFRTGTAYEITPVVGVVKNQPQFKLSAGEVLQAFTVPLSFALNPANHCWHEQVIAMPNGQERIWRWLSIDYVNGSERYFIWGATAAILRNLYWFLR